MQKIQKLNLILIAVMFFSVTAIAQDFNGYRQSNYSGVSGGDLNPANIADNRMAVDITLGGFSGTAYTNYLYFNPHQMPLGWLGTFLPDSSGVYQTQSAKDYATDPNLFAIIPYSQAQDSMNANTGGLFEFTNPGSKSRGVHYNHEIDILNFMVTISPKMAFSLGIKNRTFVNVDHVAPELLELASNALNVPSLWNVELSEELLNVSMNTWNEYNLGFGMVVMDNDAHFLKAGVKLKFLQGMASAYVYTNDIKYEFLNADTATVIQGYFNYGYSDNIDNAIVAASTNPIGDQIKTFAKNFSNLGFGGDVGVVYEWRPNWKDFKYDMDGETNIWRKDKNKYKLKASFAINDIGGIKYTKGIGSNDFSVDINSKLSATQPFVLAHFGDTDSPSAFNANIDTLVQQGNAKYDLEDKTFIMNLPTHISTSIDWHIWNAFYLNLNSFIGIQLNGNAHKVRYPTSFSLTPRYDFAWAGVSVPLSYNTLVGSGNVATGFKAGLGLRMGPIVIGTSDIKPIFSPGKDKKLAGGDIYFALKIPILRGHPRDKDLDKVSDKIDLCKEIPGVWEFKGCPDTDGDGIQDTEDKCPTEAGLREFSGCPDRDGDKVIDINDDCPDIPGLVEFKGCPDTDGDKIIDKNDECPDVVGIADFNGCPDTDGDGIKDSEDLCPDNAGPIENSGCPDTDNDGIFDYLDECPTITGPEGNHGCPWPDTDGDGLLDKDDKCPYNAGPAKNDGCPYIDTDGDGVLDKDDECVNVPGVVENKGCPAIIEEEQEILNTAFENLDFETSKAVIKEISFASLEELAALMIKKSEWKINIAGHTDSQGKPQSNLILSKKRAEAVKEFLVKIGVDVDRVVVQYFGEEQPIADNTTAEGRQKNRRVEMKVLFE